MPKSDKSASDKHTDTRVPASAETGSPASSHQSDNSNCLVLVVEDSTVNQEVATTMLDWLGCSVVVAENGVAALEAVQRAEFDLILMDCQMPEMDGLEATRALRRKEQTESTRHIPIVALTANAILGDREKCVQAGMDDYIAKPFDLEDLENALKKWCSTRADIAPNVEPKQPDTETAIGQIDPKALQNIRDLQRPGHDSVVLRLIDAYLDSSRKLIDELHRALLEGDEQTAQRSAHTLKSSSAMLGALQLAEIGEQIETHARVGNLTKIHPLMQHFDSVYLSTCASLLTLREQEI
ncbi:MAG: CheY-like chemotaxis protein/HPt (histidine-containing phosphotransfer) domain-containing protein [Halioglobus sp.]|jgi:CheY-like chemotaxis protein/HPt (histidine-containing phosphotransfer) domain-containing protein